MTSLSSPESGNGPEHSSLNPSFTGGQSEDHGDLPYPSNNLWFHKQRVHIHWPLQLPPQMHPDCHSQVLGVVNHPTAAEISFLDGTLL